MLEDEAGWAEYWDATFRENERLKMRKEREDDMSKTKEHMETQNFDLDPESFRGEDFPEWRSEPKDIMGPLVTPEEKEIINRFYEAHPQLKQDPIGVDKSRMQAHASPFMVGSERFNAEDAWIQTYSGKRFNPTNPYVDAIVIQDIAHALSNICRFTGHCSDFYSVAQHSVLVSYICNQENALYGLLHDGSEAYCQDIASPIKKTAEFSAYRNMEERLQIAVCKRFGLPAKEPIDVKKADLLLLATEARDLMAPLRPDWESNVKPLPFKIIPLSPVEAKKLFLERFQELTTCK